MAQDFKFAKYIGIGLQLAATLLFGVFLGYIADRKFKTLPWLTLTGSAVGLGVGFFNLLEELKNNGED